MRSLIFAVAGLFAMTAPLQARDRSPADLALAGAVPADIAEPRDEPWPGGAMRLAIDASDVTRGAYRVTQTIPLPTGTTRITLLYPEWLPGHHAPRGPIAELVDLRFAVDGRPAAWRRNPRYVYAFDVDLPQGARELVASFIHTSPLQKSEGRITMTGEMLNLQWEKMSLYPAGYYVRRIRVEPEVTLPPGWSAATALTGQNRSRDRVRWAETDYETLVDSPIFAGAHFRRWDLGHSVALSAVADSPQLLTLRPEHLAHLSALIEEALLTFGAPPFGHYEFLVALSERLGGIGLEHLESSENQLEPRNFVQWDDFEWDRNVLAHELVHSWNGKFRRPERLWTPDYRRPMEDELLWVYEGQTQFWGWVLAARSGLQDKDVVLGMIASAAGDLAEGPGRAWRSVADTTLDPVIAARKPKPYLSFARGEDYYHEGALTWLEADQLIREGTGGRRGLDDFAHGFFARSSDDGRLKLYDFADLVAALGRVFPYDWETFLRSRIDQPGQPAPLAGIERAGYRLVWRAEPNSYEKARMDQWHYLDLSHSLGLTVEPDGNVTSTEWGGAAFKAGIVTGVNIVAVDGIAFNGGRLTEAVTRASADRKPIELLIRRGDTFTTVPVPYFGGLRWPWLERGEGRPSVPLDKLLTARR